MDDTNFHPGPSSGKPDIQELFELVLKNALYFLHNAKHFSIETMSMEDPSYTSIAGMMSEASIMITALAKGFEEHLAQKAVEYCDLMTKMALAITSNDDLKLIALTEELNKRSFL